MYPFVPVRPTRRSYRQRYGRRWGKTFAVVATIAVTVNVLRALGHYGLRLVDQPPTWLGYAVLGGVIIGLAAGSVVNLVVAAFSDRTVAPAAQRAHQPDPRFTPYGSRRPQQDM